LDENCVYGCLTLESSIHSFRFVFHFSSCFFCSSVMCECQLFCSEFWECYCRSGFTDIHLRLFLLFLKSSYYNWYFFVSLCGRFCPYYSRMKVMKFKAIFLLNLVVK
jgi:hypothetical protein